MAPCHPLVLDAGVGWLGTAHFGNAVALSPSSASFLRSPLDGGELRGAQGALEGAAGLRGRVRGGACAFIRGRVRARVQPASLFLTHTPTRKAAAQVPKLRAQGR